MPGPAQAAVVEFVSGPDPYHVVEVEQDGGKRRVRVHVGEAVWTGCGWFGSPHDAIERIVTRYTELHAADGSLQDECFVEDDEARDIHQGKK
jgi:hypothetical protein